ncbi:MAG: hypothetical protein HKN72_17440 [Gemmatimonadetes bacterium]|nr:hypothetical protein [Gemmatimonadota bacterium]
MDDGPRHRRSGVRLAPTFLPGGRELDDFEEGDEDDDNEDDEQDGGRRQGWRAGRFSLDARLMVSG